MKNKGYNTEATGPTTSSTQNECEKCNGTGLYMFKQKMSEYMRETKRENIYGERPDFDVWVSMKCPYCNGGFSGAVHEAKKSADIPTTFYDKRLSDFDWNVYMKDDGTLADTTAAQTGVRSFVDQFETWEKRNIGLYICGKVKGCGKTFLASCICNELMATRAIKTRFVRASELIDIAQSGDKNAFDEYKRNPMKLLYECKFLVIDDLGQKNTGREWLEDTLFKLLDARMTNKRMTIITSNIDIGDLPFNERIRDRIESLCAPMHLPDISVRAKEARADRLDLFKELGLIKTKEEKNENNTEGTDT
ncbi:MAG: ATP-binding protein [Lachnospiraceae bacterium]|nr:ATP-binding protein [Lachnospiraceae bacterium]